MTEQESCLKCRKCGTDLFTVVGAAATVAAPCERCGEAADARARLVSEATAECAAHIERLTKALKITPGPWLSKPHTCHARFCEAPVKPEMLMCLKHWRMVPKELQLAVWRHYRHGQCDDKEPSAKWFEAADAAIEAVLRKECAEAKTKPVTSGGFRP